MYQQSDQRAEGRVYVLTVKSDGASQLLPQNRDRRLIGSAESGDLAECPWIESDHSINFVAVMKRLTKRRITM